MLQEPAMSSEANLALRWGREKSEAHTLPFGGSGATLGSMKRTPILCQAPSGLGPRMRINSVADFLRLIGKRVCIEDKVGIVKDLSDSGRHLILVRDSSVYEEVTIPLETIHFVEILDANPAFTSGLVPQEGLASARVHIQEGPKSRRKRRRSGSTAPPAPHPMPLRVLYDQTTDCLYLRLSTNDRSTAKPVIPDCHLDLDAHGKPVGIEFQQATKHLAYSKPILAKLRFKLDLDEAADRLRLALPGITTEKNVEGQEGISFHFDREGRLAQLTISGASTRLDLVSLGLRLP